MESENSLVWAKMRYCPYWPAKIVDTPKNIGKAPKGKICVLFFGTKQYGFVDVDKIENYSKYREKFISKGKGNDFKLAVQQMDEYILDPMKYCNHVMLESTMSKLPIKTERDIELSLGIVKTEPKSPKQLVSTEVDCGEHSWQKEKQMFIEQIMTLKKESHDHLLELKKCQSECKSLESEKKKLMQTLADITAIQKENEKVIADLKREKQLLVAQTKQFQTGWHQSKNNERPKQQSSDNEYEVEKILNHRDIVGRQYLVRWAGYDSSEDTWEYEKNLHCAKLLNQYIRSNGLTKKSK